jgi:hypothetical protein
MQSETIVLLGRSEEALIFWHTYYGNRPGALLADIAGDVLSTLIELKMISRGKQIIVYSASAEGGGIEVTIARPASAPELLITTEALSEGLRSAFGLERGPSDGYMCIRVTMGPEARPQTYEFSVGAEAKPWALESFKEPPGGLPPIAQLHLVEIHKDN